MVGTNFLIIIRTAQRYFRHIGHYWIMDESAEESYGGNAQRIYLACLGRDIYINWVKRVICIRHELATKTRGCL